MDGIKDIFDEAQMQVVFSGHPAMFSYAFGVDQVTNQRNWSKGDEILYLDLVDALIERGVMPDHDPREPWFLCYSHSDSDIDQTLNVMADAIKVVKKHH